ASYCPARLSPAKPCPIAASKAPPESATTWFSPRRLAPQSQATAPAPPRTKHPSRSAAPQNHTKSPHKQGRCCSCHTPHSKPPRCLSERHRKYKNNGAPTADVITPTGKVVEKTPNAERAIKSASVKNAAPPSAQA